MRSGWSLAFCMVLACGACSSDKDTDPKDTAADLGQDVNQQPLDTVDTAPEGDVGNADLDSPDEVDVVLPPAEDPGVRMRKAGWMAGDLHLHTTYSDGDDSVAIVVALAEYLEDPVFLAAHPEYVGNPLDFISITDHRTVDHHADPDMKSDKLVIIPGEEYGGSGHAGVWGLTEHIPHDPDNDGLSHADYQHGADEAHKQGALFSINHPFIPDILFAWDVRNHDAMEICNAAWALMGPALTAEKLAEWEVAKGTTASPTMKKATQYLGMGGNQQSMKLYEAQLTLGIHVALVGGSDRHVFFPVGFPTTWVKGESDDVNGVLEGIRKRHTFVGRTPASAVLETTVTVDDKSYEMGDKVPLSGPDQQVVISLRVGRADGGKVKIIRGGRVYSDAALQDAELGVVAFEANVDSADFTVETTLTFSPDEWFYVLVLETVVAPNLPAEQIDEIPGMAKAASGFSEEDVTPLAEALWKYIDPQVALSPAKCDPAKWESLDLQCMPADTNGLSSFFFPDWIQRALNVVMENGEPTDWTLGAVGSAVVFEAAK